MTDHPLNPVPYRRIHPGYQFLLLIGLLIFSLIVGTIGGMIVISIKYGFATFNYIVQENLTAPNVTTAIWILQFFGTTLPILVTPLIFAYFIVEQPDDYLKNNFHFPWLLIVLVLVTMLLCNPFIEFLGNLNAKMVLPKFLHGVQEWMRKSEDDTKKLSDLMLQMNTFWSMIFDLLFIGLLTAIVEEFLFRGCMQTIFIRWFNNKHVAVWTTAILFSAFHMEFFGFLPRVLLGILFGYFTVYSGSIWPAIWGHFVNNGTAVVVTYLFQHKLINMSPDDEHSFTNAGYVISAVITVFLLIVYRNIAIKRQIAHNGEELD